MIEVKGEISSLLFSAGPERIIGAPRTQEIMTISHAEYRATRYTTVLHDQ
jgi:hypothetical protein